MPGTMAMVVHQIFIEQIAVISHTEVGEKIPMLMSWILPENFGRSELTAFQIKGYE